MEHDEGKEYASFESFDKLEKRLQQKLFTKGNDEIEVYDNLYVELPLNAKTKGWRICLLN